MAMCSDGTAIANPKALRKNIKKLIRAHRRLSRRTKGGKNRAKARKQLARMYYRVGNIRRDTLHKATTFITAKPKREKKQREPKQSINTSFKKQVRRRERPQTIVLEDLNVAGMKKNRKLAQAISDVGMGEFKRQMKYKSEWNKETFMLADRFYPSTKRCSRCGHVKEKMSLAERVYMCENDSCRLVLDRDLNAALNLVALAR